MLDDLVADTRKDKKVEKRLRRIDTSDKVLSSRPFVFSSLRQKRLPRSDSAHLAILLCALGILSTLRDRHMLHYFNYRVLETSAF